MRYDVDRPVSAETIRNIVGRQRRLANAPCGSWYVFSDTLANASDARSYVEGFQEVGVHCLAPSSEPVGGLGATHHSAPISSYWQGDATNRALDAGGARYGEFLAGQTLVPRPAWITEPDGNGRMGTMWTTPIHFPLEGSTRDLDLGYFDQLRDRFREAVALGGHVIVGTHPDLNQDLFDALLEREALENVWFAPVGTVVDRCRAILGHGAVTMAEGDPLTLVAETDICDLTVEIWDPGADEPRVEITQLRARQPRALPDRAGAA